MLHEARASRCLRVIVLFVPFTEEAIKTGPESRAVHTYGVASSPHADLTGGCHMDRSSCHNPEAILTAEIHCVACGAMTSS